MGIFLGFFSLSIIYHDAAVMRRPGFVLVVVSCGRA